MSTCDDQLMLTFESMHEFFEDNKKDQCEDQAYKETKKPSFKHLGAQIKHIILFASAPKPYHEPSTKPTEFTALFLKGANISKAATTLQQELNRRNINFVVSQSLVAALGPTQTSHQTLTYSIVKNLHLLLTATLITKQKHSCYRMELTSQIYLKQ